MKKDMFPFYGRWNGVSRSPDRRIVPHSRTNLFPCPIILVIKNLFYETTQLNFQHTSMMELHYTKNVFQSTIFLFIKLTIILIIVSFSSGLLTAIIRVSATNALSAILLFPFLS